MKKKTKAPYDAHGSHRVSFAIFVLATKRLGDHDMKIKFK